MQIWPNTVSSSPTWTVKHQGSRYRILSLITVAALVSGCGLTAPPSFPTTTQHKSVSTASTIHVVPSTTSTTSAPTTTTTIDPGTLPQTTQEPSTNTIQFQQMMQTLWLGIVNDDMAYATQAFFPLAAYLQIKAISDPGPDYAYRLMEHFTMDIEAAHNLIMSQGSDPKFLYVATPTANAAWIVPGYCYNKEGYWHLPGSRLVYSVNGVEHSIGIESLISWRGVYYVVHLGAISRSTNIGYVDNPALGQGSFGPPGGC